jgi:hypothetical protein
MGRDIPGPYVFIIANDFDMPDSGWNFVNLFVGQLHVLARFQWVFEVTVKIEIETDISIFTSGKCNGGSGGLKPWRYSTTGTGVV